MNSIVATVVINYVVSELASSASTVDWTKVKANAHAAIEKEITFKAADVALEKVLDGVVDGLAKVCQDKPELKAALSALAAHDFVTAKKTAKNLLQPVVSSELAPLLAAA